MNEAHVRLEVRHALEAAGYEVQRLPDAIVCPNCKHKIVPERGWPDLSAIHPTGPGCFIEVKVLRRNETSFSFSEIRDDQREWLDDRADRGYRVFLALGIIRPAGSRSKLEAIYLIPWPCWIVAEVGISRYQDSIPYQAGKGFSKELQEREWDIVHLLKDFQLVQEDGIWRLPGQSSAAEVQPVSGDIRLTNAERQPGYLLCGHPATSIVSADEGTHYCKECENAAHLEKTGYS